MARASDFGDRTLPLWLGWLALALVGVGLLVYLALFLRRVLVLASYPFDFDQGEGYDVWTAWLIWQCQPNYTANDAWPYFSSNYPPLFFALLAPLLGLFGPIIGIGRLLAAAATLLTGLLVFMAARDYSRHTLASAFAALLFLASTYVYHVGALARVNTLMALLALAGVYCAAKPTRPRVALAMLFLLLAAFTKPTAVDALAAVLLFLAMRDWRLALVSGAATAAIGLAGVAVLDLSSGGGFLLNVVAGNANPWDPWQAFVYLTNFIGVHDLIALGAIGTLWLRRREPLSIYPVFLGVVGVASLGAGKWGAGESYFLETLTALCVVAAPFLAYLLRHPRPWMPLAAAGALSLQLALYGHGATLEQSLGLRDIGFQAHALAANPTTADVEAGSELVTTYIQKWDGPVLAEEPGFVLAAGKPVIGNTTQLRNLDQAGRWNADSLVNDVRGKRFDFVILHAQLYPPRVLAAIGRHYYVYATVRVNGYNYQVFAPGAD